VVKQHDSLKNIFTAIAVADDISLFFGGDSKRKDLMDEQGIE
jgi:hypothetical protein